MPKTPHISRPPSRAEGRPRRPRARRPAATSSASSPQRSAMLRPAEGADSLEWHLGSVARFGQPLPRRRARSSRRRGRSSRRRASPPRSSRGSIASPRARAGRERHLGERDRETAVGDVVREPSTPSRRELAEQVAEPAQRRKIDLGDAARSRAAHERLPLRAVVGGRRPCRARRASRSRRPAPRGTAASARSSTPTQPTTGVGWIGRPPLSL